MALSLWMRGGKKRGRSVKYAARHVSKDSPNHMSTRQLERLYAAHGPALERSLLRQHGDKYADAATKIEDLIAKDGRAAILAKEHVPGIPPRRWYPAELEEFLATIALLEES